MIQKNAPTIHLHHLTEDLDASRDMVSACATVLRPRPRMSTSRWAETYRTLKEGTTEKPGRWSNDYFPYLRGIQDVVDEAIETGRRGVVLMKSGQGGGSEAMTNAVGHLADERPGPMLYMISKDDLAREFGHERFTPLMTDCEPLRAKALLGRGSRTLTHLKRFVDGKIVIQGGKSILNLQSSPYKYVFIDEYDSLQDEMDGSDPLSLAEIRTDAFPGRTLIVAFAHPSTRARGAGKLYYDKSDMRRGFVICPHCLEEFFLQWDHVKPVAELGLTDAQAARDKRCYKYFAPCCGAEISDAQRTLICKDVKYKSILKPEEAAQKPYIGVHFSQLYMPNKSIEFLAEHWIEGLDDEPKKRVFINKRMGDVYDPAVKETTADAWSRIVCIRRKEKDPEYWERGQVPLPVRFLTAGQDSRTKELHWAVWGWGRLRDEAGYPTICGWLVDCGIVERAYSPTLEESDLRVFDQVLYERTFEGVPGGTGAPARQFEVMQGLHDWSWQPIAIENYCLRTNGRAAPCRGDAVDSNSKKPTFRWGAGARRRIGDQESPDARVKVAYLNTYTLKENFFSLVAKHFKTQGKDGVPGEIHPRLMLPVDVPQRFIEESASEYLAVEKKHLVWKHKGPNHYSDCNIYAYAAALEIFKMHDELPLEEVQSHAEAEQSRQRRRESQTKPSWIKDRGGEWISER